ncbi:hypothetical protein BHS06_11495 [Myxococcus xanthus]|nr:hypothetical protein BHS06_11495 [Myxococcus xanthus]
MIPYYMPVVSRQTYSGRKLRDSLLPLFPGFVFVKGNHTKGAFKDTGCVASVLNPASQLGIEVLDGQIRSVRRMLALGGPVELTTKYEIGEKLTIDSGPLRGISGTVTSTANTKKLVLWVDMLGVGAAVELGCDTILAKAGAVQARSFQLCSAGPTR